ncbi:MAG TPA: elongation factor 4 [Clostridiales bacterium]|nr:elongation factor 4 [Clostridiales bacterium]
MTDKSHIRNFCIIAHIDHGKSTLADRLIEKTGLVAKRDMKDQLLDNMELERERGITIKLTPTKMNYVYNGENYELNLIDTPGHVDFSYEVSRSLAACEGAILIVDATQGVQAQTLANLYLAIENDLEILPVINKIDLQSADIPNAIKEIEEICGLDGKNAPQISAKNGINIEDVLNKIVTDIPAPKGEENAPLKALIFDSYYDNYRGAICMVRIKEGSIKPDQTIKMFSTGREYEVVEVGYFEPQCVPCDELKAGEVGWISASIKTISDIKVGDTIFRKDQPIYDPLPGYKEAVPMVYCGIFLEDGSKYQELKDALEKLKLNDASLSYEPEKSEALGSGFLCGFLGLLHMEIVQERLEREFDLDIISTTPSVNYKILKTNGEQMEISNPASMPKPQEIDTISEPWCSVEIFTPPEYVGGLISLCIEKRGEQKDLKYIDSKRVNLSFDMPLNEIISDFFDKVKSASKGYASLDYEIKEYRPSDLVKMDVLLNGEMCDALSTIVYRPNAYSRGKAITEKLKEILPRQMFEIPIQAAIGGKIIARETIKAMRKDVLAKCYGGDITRKKKLLEKQKKGKKRMRQLGKVQIPSDAFISLLKI